MLLLSGSEVEALLDLEALVDALADAMADLSAGRASVPNRVAAVIPERDGLLAAMPAYDPANAALTTKLVSLFPGNAGTALPAHQAVIAAFDPATGEPIALYESVGMAVQDAAATAQVLAAATAAGAGRELALFSSAGM